MYTCSDTAGRGRYCLLFFFFLSVLLPASGCRRKAPVTAPAPVSGPALWDPLSLLRSIQSHQKESVALVNGVSISLEQVRRQMARAKMDQRTALSTLIEEELVFQAALGESSRKEKDSLYKSTAVYHLIEKDFERKNTPESISDESLRNVYKEIQAPAFSKSFGSFKFLFAHGEWRRPLQLIVKKKSLVSKDVVSSVTSMFSLVKSWYDLQPVKSPESFQQSAWLVQNSYYEVDFENRLDPISMKWEENFYRSGLAYDKKFKEALFAIPSENETSPPFRTRHGIHWVFYKKRYPVQNKSFEEIKDKLREKLSLSFRTRAFSAWMAGLRKKYSASMTARSIR